MGPLGHEPFGMMGTMEGKVQLSAGSEKFGHPVLHLLERRKTKEPPGQSGLIADLHQEKTRRPQRPQPFPRAGAEHDPFRIP